MYGPREDGHERVAFWAAVADVNCSEGNGWRRVLRPMGRGELRFREAAGNCLLMCTGLVPRWMTLQMRSGEIQRPKERDGFARASFACQKQCQKLFRRACGAARPENALPRPPRG